MLCDKLEGWDGVGVGERFKKERMYVQLWLIHSAVWLKPTQHCKAIILQLKINFKSMASLFLMDGHLSFLTFISISHFEE